MDTKARNKIDAILKTLSPKEREALEAVFIAEAEGNTQLAKQLRTQVYLQERPPLEHFLFDKEYLGFHQAEVYPAILEVMHLLDDPSVREGYIAAGKGSGKSTVVSAMMARAVHDLTCYVDPAAYFGMISGEHIAIVNMSIGAEQAENVMLNKFWNLCTRSPMFHKDGEPTFIKRKRHIEFPALRTHVLSGHSGYKAYFGYNVYMGSMDEMSWFKDTEDHPITEEIYSGLLAAAKTRFDGHYKIMGISSPESQDDGLMQRINLLRREGQEIPMLH